MEGGLYGQRGLKNWKEANASFQLLFAVSAFQELLIQGFSILQ
jgi:hypothetical protein